MKEDLISLAGRIGINILVSILLYLFGSFISLSFNILVWDTGLRAFIALLLVSSNFLYKLR